MGLKAIWKFPGLKEHLHNCLKGKFGVWMMVNLGTKDCSLVSAGPAQPHKPLLDLKDQEHGKRNTVS